MKISLLQITNRPGNIDILLGNMKRQTEQDYEVVLVDGLWREREEEVKAYIDDPRLVYVRQSDKREGAYTNLAHADNEGFRACSGELIVCLQDYLWINPSGFTRYWEVYQDHPTALVTGVGNQYNKPYPTNPNGKITVFDKPYTKRPEGLFWTDPRCEEDPQTTFSERPPVSWELNWASIPNKVIKDLGGMDEEFDFHGFAFDNTYIATKAQLMGYKIYLDKGNECMGFNHDGWWPNPLKVNRVSPVDYFVQSIKDMKAGVRPIKDKYL